MIIHHRFKKDIPNLTTILNHHGDKLGVIGFWLPTPTKTVWELKSVYIDKWWLKRYLVLNAIRLRLGKIPKGNWITESCAIFFMGGGGEANYTQIDLHGDSALYVGGIGTLESAIKPVWITDLTSSCKGLHDVWQFTYHHRSYWMKAMYTLAGLQIWQESENQFVLGFMFA